MNYNNLTDAQTERLSLLSEELGEAIQAVGKILRHGYRTDGGWDNQRNLEIELGHVQYAVGLLRAENDLDIDCIDEAFNIKSENIEVYLHHQRQETINGLQEDS